ncbi:MAG: dockerin type I domain-containing protein [Planctomycetota bacterium]|nr:dockerin type I domain-containing protein [Planctomycetota bacterium]
MNITSPDASGLNLSMAITVLVPNVYEAPTNIGLSANTVAESTPGAALGHVTDSDPDAGETHTRTVSDSRFEIVGGQLKLKAGQSLDFETGPSISLNITATDAGGLNLTKAFTVLVTNVNEAPTNIGLSANVVAENAAGAAIGNVTVSDPDAGDTHTLTVSDSRFEIVGGQLKLKAGQSLDFETAASVGLNITATDAGGLNLTKTFTVLVTNVNEAPTNITLSANVVAENAPGAIIGNVTVSDPDAGDTHALTVSDSRFEIVGGQLKLKAGQSLDFHTAPSVSLNILAQDAGGLELTKPFSIVVTNVNVAPTDITLSGNTLAEQTASAPVGSVAVTDPNPGDTHTLTVSDSRFEIVSSQLKLKAGQTLDFETAPSVSLNITATDAGGLNLTKAFTILVIDVNETPTSIALDPATVDEHLTGAGIGWLSAVDPDAGDTAAFAVSDNRFEVVGRHLKLKAGQSLDRDLAARVSVEVTATDRGQLSLRQTLQILVAANPSPWCNGRDPLDVDQDGKVAPLDVLRLISELNSATLRDARGRLPADRPADSDAPYFDPSGDGFITPVDALTVINYLNGYRVSGEGEAQPIDRHPSNSPVLLTDASPDRVADGSLHQPIGTPTGSPRFPTVASWEASSLTRRPMGLVLPTVPDDGGRIADAWYPDVIRDQSERMLGEAFSSLRWESDDDWLSLLAQDVAERL